MILAFKSGEIIDEGIPVDILEKENLQGRLRRPCRFIIQVKN